jgi:hypothetical protein
MRVRIESVCLLRFVMLLVMSMYLEARIMIKRDRFMALVPAH